MSILTNVSSGPLGIRDSHGTLYEIAPYGSLDVGSNPTITYNDVFSLVNAGLLTVSGAMFSSGSLGSAPPSDGSASNVPANGNNQLIATVNNSAHAYTTMVMTITNNTTNALTDFIIRTKSNPADATYMTTYTKADDYTNPKGYLQEVSTDISTISSTSGQARFVMNIYYFSSIQVLVNTSSATNVSVSYRLLS